MWSSAVYDMYDQLTICILRCNRILNGTLFIRRIMPGY